MTRSGWIRVTSFVLAAALIALIYHPILHHSFLHWDDGTYVAANPYINRFDWTFVSWALTTTYFSYWHPLTWLSHGLDFALWKMNAGGHLLTNLLLYGAVALGVFVLTLSLLGKAFTARAPPLVAGETSRALTALLATLLFVVHPQHVEVVAWVSERKELLSTIFSLATVIAYLEYGVRRTRAWLLLTYLAFLLALMSKPMSVSLPAVLIVLDFYPLKRVTRANWWRVVIIEKIPFLLSSALLALFTVFAQSENGAINFLPLDVRVLNAFNNSIFYLRNWAWPFNLCAFYPFPRYVLEFDWRALIPVSSFVAITAFAIARFRAGYPYWLASWLIYLVTLLPVIGLLHAGPQAAADRYAHLPTIGFYVLLAAGVVQAAKKRSAQFAGVTALVITVAVVALGWTSHRLIANWRNDLSLWQSVAQRYPGQSAIVHNNLGNAWLSHDEFALAEQHYMLAIEAPDGPGDAYQNLAVALRAGGAGPRAITVFKTLSKRHPNSGVPLLLLGEYYEKQGDRATAMSYYRRALTVDRQLAESHFRLARLHLADGDEQAAIVALENAVALAPDYVDAQLLLARIHMSRGLMPAALALYSQAYRIAPTYAPAYRGYIVCLRAAGLSEAAELVGAQARRLRDYRS